MNTTTCTSITSWQLHRHYKCAQFAVAPSQPQRKAFFFIDTVLLKEDYGGIVTGLYKYQYYGGTTIKCFPQRAPSVSCAICPLRLEISNRSALRGCAVPWSNGDKRPTEMPWTDWPRQMEESRNPTIICCWIFCRPSTLWYAMEGMVTSHFIICFRSLALSPSFRTILVKRTEKKPGTSINCR
jgi:hypothetical protein